MKLPVKYNFSLHSVGEVQGVLLKYERTYKATPQFKAECMVYAMHSMMRLYLSGNDEYTDYVEKTVDYGGITPFISYEFIKVKASCKITKVDIIVDNITIKEYEDILNK